MPKVPRVTEPSVGFEVVRGGVTPRPQPNIGSQLADAGTQIASFAEKIQREEDLKVDRTRLLQARSAALRSGNDLLTNPEYGALHKKGQDAFGIENTYMPKMVAIWDAQEQGLTSDRQRAGFAEFRAQQEIAFLGQLRGHETKQRDFVHDETAKAADAAAVDHIGRNALDPSQVEFGIKERLNAFHDIAERNGLPDDVRQQERERIVATSHALVVQAYADRKMYVDAAKYAEDHAAEIGADAKTKESVTSFLKIAAQQDKAERRDAIRWARQQESWRQTDVYNQISKRVYLGEKPTTSELANLTPEYRAAILRQMDGQSASINWDLYQELSRMRATNDREILDVRLEDLPAQGFTATQIAKVATWQRDVEQGKDAGAKDKSVYTDNQTISMALKPMFADSDGKTDRDAMMARNNAMLQIAQEVDVVRAEKGAAFTNQDLNDIIGRHVVEIGRTQGKWADPDDADEAWTMDISDSHRVPFSVVPSSFKARVTDIAKRRGLSSDGLSAEEVAEMYTRYILSPDDRQLDVFVRAMAGAD